MDDLRAVELYAQFRTHYQKHSPLPIVQSTHLSGGRTMTGAMIPFVESASDFLRELFNSINDFRRWILTLEAWGHVYDGCGDEDRLSILVEHIRPFATLALNGPQAIRGRIIHAAAVGCSHANNLLHRANTSLQWDGTGHLTMKVASRIGQPWASWKTLAPLLSERLGHGPIHDLTDDFRNQHEHGHPRNIGLGLTASVVVKERGSGQRSWSIGSREAISIATVIEQTSEQHALAVEAYGLFCALAKEQFEALIAYTSVLLPR
ncbi:hypothetical protein [Pseudomonas sp. EMN2]|uniref:hypothetical protein n=1 Tax=Pseudomonas sp. EMN2 TaxID=2615212 RepID=UPI00129A2A84|nr:hypothetical protein [Pseudomonas sp. EMN2]